MSHAAVPDAAAVRRLSARVRAGDRTAFDELVGRIRPALHGYAAALTNDPHLADDIVQEALVRAWSRLDSLRDPARLRGWLYRIVEHTALSQLRSRSRRRERPLFEADTIGSDRVGEGDPARERARGERVRRVAEAIDRLPASHARVVRLHYAGGRTCAEVATALGLTPGNVRVRLHRARRALRADLGRA